MSQGKRRTPEQIIYYLLEAEILLSQGHSVPEVCKRLGISIQSYYCYRK
jgi:transposase